MVQKLRPKNYIRWVNKQVRMGKHNRPIKVIYTNQKPIGGISGKRKIATHTGLNSSSKIYIWKGLAKNKDEEMRVRKKLAKKYNAPLSRVRAITREAALFHELQHIINPSQTEKQVIRKERLALIKNRLTLPKILPPKISRHTGH